MQERENRFEPEWKAVFLSQIGPSWAPGTRTHSASSQIECRNAHRKRHSDRAMDGCLSPMRSVSMCYYR